MYAYGITSKPTGSRLTFSHISTPIPLAAPFYLIVISPSGQVAGPAECPPVARVMGRPPAREGDDVVRLKLAARGAAEDAAVAVSPKHFLSEALALAPVAPAGAVAGAAA